MTNKLSDEFRSQWHGVPPLRDLLPTSPAPEPKYWPSEMARMRSLLLPRVVGREYFGDDPQNFGDDPLKWSTVYRQLEHQRLFPPLAKAA